MRAVSIEFRGQTYTVPAHRAFALGDAVETVAPLLDIVRWRANPPFRKLARCYGEVLRFAGVQIEGRPISDEEVFADIIGTVKALLLTEEETTGLFHQQIIDQLIDILLDGMPKAVLDAEELPAAKKTRG